MEPLRIWFDPPHVRWGRVVATVLIVTGLVGLWVAQRRGLFEPARTPVVVTGAAAAGVLAAKVPHGQRPAGPATAAVEPPAPAASSAELVCGSGKVSFDPHDEKQIERLTREAIETLEAHRPRVLPGWLEEMKSSADAQLQAAAWFLEAQRAWAKRVESTPQAEPLESLDVLVRLAERSRDALIYSLAFQSCDLHRKRGEASRCDALRVEAWSELDPANAFPWLFAAGRETLDAQRRTQYIERALAADTMHSTWGAMHAVLAKAAPPQEAPLDRSVRFLEATSVEAFVSSSQGAVLSHCAESELRQGARRQQCERLASFLTDKSDTLQAVSVGQGIGRRLGWSEDRLARLKREAQALQDLIPSDAAIAGCDGLARGEAYFADVAKYGEIGALRRRQQAAATTAAR